MSVSSVPSTTGTTTPTTTNNQTVTGPSASSLQDQFLQLLTVQLQNQDPTSPVDQTQMLAQLAQFSSLEQMQNLNTTMASATSFSGLTESAGLIGKTVTTLNSDGSAGPSGVVSSVSMTNGAPYLQIGNQSVAASTVATVTN